MRPAVLLALILSGAACQDQKPVPASIDDPASYRPAVASDQNGRAIFAAGLSLPVPAAASVAYPQGIDSRILHIDGLGYSLNLDDYGAFNEPATTRLAGAPAQLEEQRAPGCRFRVWRARLPATSPTHLRCSSEEAGDCTQAPAQATIATFCTSEAACREVDAILAGARFGPKPWPAVPLPDPDLRPQEPACKPS